MGCSSCRRQEETELEGIGGEGRRSKTISKSLIRERHNILIATMASSPVDTAGATTRTRTLGPYVAVRPPRVELTRAPPRGTSQFMPRARGAISSCARRDWSTTTTTTPTSIMTFEDSQLPPPKEDCPPQTRSMTRMNSRRPNDQVRGRDGLRSSLLTSRRTRGHTVQCQLLQ
jgi:hypothetical protein